MRVVAIVVLLAGALSGCGASEPGQGGGDTGIRGVLLSAPGCPAESMASPCPGMGLVGQVQVTRAGTSEVVAEAVSSAHGDFRVTVPAGRYVVRASSSTGVMRPPTSRAIVTVQPHQVARVTLRFDSGIRIAGSAPG